MKEKKNYMKKYWWIIAIVIFIIGLPILLNFFVFKPTNQLSVGRLEDWMEFWGSYLGATISALAAFIILAIQRKDAKQNYERIRADNTMQYFHRKKITELENAIKSDKENKKNRQKQTNQIIYQQELQWLGNLRKALVNYISTYAENEIKSIINSVSGSSYESVQQKIKILYDTLTQTNIALGLIICENPCNKIGTEHKKELANLHTRYISIINDIQLLVCLYYGKVHMFNSASDNLKLLIEGMRVNPKKIDYNQFSKLAHEIIKPLSDIFNAVQVISQKCIIDERTRIDSLLNEAYGEK